jgi:GTP-binding protein LepA
LPQFGRFASAAASGEDTVVSKSIPPGVVELLAKLDSIPMERIRNFSIVAHVDHGKSTLADRILEQSGNIFKPGEAPATKSLAADESNEQVLDSLKVERERGITVKAQTASILFHPDGDDGSEPYLLNLIDTPGHVDFAYEVSRSLAACQGALLLVDCAQGVQAQTVANHSAATKANLAMVPVLTKIDLPNADPEPALEQMEAVLGLAAEDAVWTSGKTGEGVRDALLSLIKTVPPPTGKRDAPTRALLFDSWYDEFRGVICVLQVIDGQLNKGDRITLAHGDSAYTISEMGILTPTRYPVGSLASGQVGYVITGMRDPREAVVGDTVMVASGAGAVSNFPGHAKLEPLPGFEPAKPMVFASIFPVETSDFDSLRIAVEKLSLTDASVTLMKENSSSLGFGYRCGFLGLLHMDVFHQRLADDFDMPVIATAPMVPYRLQVQNSTKIIEVERPDDFPDPAHIVRTFEPMVKASVIVPSNSLSAVMSLMQDHRARQDEINYLDDGRVLMRYTMPWQEVVTNFFDKIKSATAGYATFDYEPSGYEESPVVKVDMLLNGRPVDALSFATHRDSAEVQGRRVAQKLRSVIKRQQFEVVIQAAMGKKVFARERIPPFRKDVLSRSGKTVGGGDLTRKKKLLEKQKKGKARMRSVGDVQLSQDAFHSVLTR